MDNYQIDVLAYHIRFGNIIGDTKAPKIQNGPFRAAFIREESLEFRVALYQDDAVEMADALCDLLYVTIGAAVEFGIDICQHVPAFPSLKPRPTMALLDNKAGWCQRIFDAAEACAKAISTEHVGRTAWALAGMVEVIRAAVEAWGIDLRPMWEEVHATNMKKRPSGRPDVKTIKPPGWKRPDLAPILAEQYGFTDAAEVVS